MRFLRSSADIKTRVATAFWLFGLINNVLYVIILSAAVDLVPSNIPKGVVLLADIFPSFAAKLFAPYVIHFIPYGPRTIFCASSSALGMLLIAYTPLVPVKLCGIGFASLSAGLGEMTFLGLTHFFSGQGYVALAGFSSGTGAAGLIGSGAYAFATTTLGFSSRATITASSILPAVLVLCYFFILPKEEAVASHRAYDSRRPGCMGVEDETTRMLEDVPPSPIDRVNLLSPVHSRRSTASQHSIWSGLKANLFRAQKLLHP